MKLNKLNGILLSLIFNTALIQAQIKPTKTLHFNKEVELTAVKLNSNAAISQNKSVTSLSAPKVSRNPESIKGRIDVSGNGALLYTVPIDNLPAANDLAPQIALAYNSQAGNGIAGYGWSITGFSTISRNAANQLRDGYDDPIDFDNNDQLSLDGTRLMLVSGTHMKRGAVYQTEIYSNKKIIISEQSGNFPPSGFQVLYPDGTQAFYGRSSHQTVSWMVELLKDPQNNEIAFRYEYPENEEPYLKRVLYGTRDNSKLNVIEFNYVNRKRHEQSFIGGSSSPFRMTKILKSIRVKAGKNTYRRYNLTHDVTSLGYERLVEIQELNGYDDFKSPIVFKYGDTEENLVAYRPKEDIKKIFPGFLIRNDKIAVGDFNGYGGMDLILQKGKSSNKIYLFTEVGKGGAPSLATEYDVSRYQTVFASDIVDSKGQHIDRQGITTINDKDGVLDIKTYALTPSNLLAPQFDKRINLESGTLSTDYDCRTITNTPLEHVLLPGDYNGDGITDILAIDKNTKVLSCRVENPFDCQDDSQCCSCVEEEISVEPNIAFIDLDRRNPSKSTSIKAGRLAESITSKSLTITADYNNDGKTDLLHFLDGKLSIYSLNNKSQLIRTTSFFDANIKVDRPVLIGDYNGDGFLDYTIPDSEKSSLWNMYLGNGQTFKRYSQAIQYYQKTGPRIYPPRSPIKPEDKTFIEYQYIATDYNGDGKSDIISLIVESPIFQNSSKVTQPRMTVRSSIYSDETKSQIAFEHVAGFGTGGGGGRDYSIPGAQPSPLLRKNGLLASWEYNKRTKRQEVIYVDVNYLHTLEFEKNHKVDIELKSIENNGLVTNIAYNYSLDSFPRDVYSKDLLSVKHPIEPLLNLDGIRVVSNLRQITDNITRYKGYRYHNALIDRSGRGFLGFEVFSSTNWYGNEVTKIWTNTKRDFDLRGLPSDMWTSFNSGIEPSNYITHTIKKYEPKLLSKKVFYCPVVATKYIDNLKGTIENETVKYDSYGNPLSIIKGSLGAINYTYFTYYNNQSAIDGTYHVGRPKTEIQTATLGSEQFTTRKTFSYSNNLLKQLTKQSNKSNVLTFTYTYDNFGNILTKTSPGNNRPRQSTYTYDKTGRYLTSSIDYKGLKTTNLYDETFGLLTKATDPLGQVSIFKYDNWQREKEATNYKGKTTYTKFSGSNGRVTIERDYPEGGDTRTVYNALGWKTSEMQLILSGTKNSTIYLYDEAGRVRKVSEPYIDGSGFPDSYNTTAYDRYGRILSQQLVSGKVTTYKYDNLKTTIDDGTMVKEIRTNVNGNIIEVKDPGGIIRYQYYANGQQKSIDREGHKITIKIDDWGRRKELNDPSAGKFTYAYNKAGQLTTETRPNNAITTYQYDNNDLLKKKIMKSNSANYETEYTYNSKFQIEKEFFKGDGIFTIIDYQYDNLGFTTKVDEVTSGREFGSMTNQLDQTYDEFGRISTVKYKSSYNGPNGGKGPKSYKTVKNVYDESGSLVELRDKSNRLLWKLNEVNARKQVTKSTYGNGFINENIYNNLGQYKSIKSSKTNGSSTTVAMNMLYDFDPTRNRLNGRTNKVFNWKESFKHDSQDRLLQTFGPKPETQRYNDRRGHIEYNSKVGKYNYDVTKDPYKVRTIELDDKGNKYYGSRERRKIEYDGFKNPLKIHENRVGNIFIKYGIDGNRVEEHFGSKDNRISEQKYSRYYSSIMPVEVHINKELYDSKILTYIGGDAYSAPIVHISTGYQVQEVQENYIHRDYLGSILAITDEQGSILEQTQYSAWGHIDKMIGVNGKPITKNHSTTSILGRGFTGHQHYSEMGLINMNGRIYDPKLKIFLSVDNNIQEPFNTLSYNRYSYVLNNPLMYNDPSGEIFFTTAVIIAIAVGAAAGAYLGGAQAMGTLDVTKWQFNSKLVAGIVGGAALGAVTGIFGAAITPAVITVTGTTLFGSIAAGAITGGIIGAMHGGMMSQLPGGDGNFGKGMLTGAVQGAVAGAIVGGAAKLLSKSKFIQGLLGNKENPRVTPIDDLQTQGIKAADDVQSLSADGLNLNKAPQATTSSAPQKAPTVQAGIDGGASGNLRIEALPEVVVTSNKSPKLLGPAGDAGAKVANQVPKNWTMKMAKKGGGTRFVDPNNSGNHVRVMRGDPNSPFLNSRTPYTIRYINGAPVDRFGNQILNSTGIMQNKSPNLHVPIGEFKF